MPAHALPPGPEYRAQRRLAGRLRRRRSRENWRDSIPAALVMVPAFVIAGGPDALHGIVGLLRATATIVVVAVALMLVLLPVAGRAERMSAAQTAARPRWQYLLGSAGYLGQAACCVLGAAHATTGWVGDPLGVLGWWSGVAGLGMLGRAVCWGRVRELFWWHRPPWLAATPQTGAELS